MFLPQLKEVSEDIWHLDSCRDGKELMVLGGVHGNEKSGILAVHELVAGFIARPSGLLNGRLTLAIGNPEAVRANARGSAPHLDLNRCFLPERLADASVYEHRRAAELLPWLNRADVMVDLHATNKPSDPFLAVTKLTPRHDRLAECFDCPYLVLNEDDIIPGMAQGWVNARGGTALVFESGQADDLSCMLNVRTAVERTLALYGLTAPVGSFVPMQKKRFQICSVLNLTSAGFHFAQGRGLASFEPMADGDVIGHAGGNPVLAPFDGVLMFPKIPSLWKVGSPLVFFARKI